MAEGGAWPALSDLVPHAGAMRLLDRVVEHDRAQTVCEVDVDAQSLFRREDGALPSWASLEYMAQCVAAHAGLLAREAGERPPAAGLFLGSRRVELRVDTLPAGARLRVCARPVASSSEGLHAFECAVEDGAGGPPLAEARLAVLVPRDLERFLSEAETAAEEAP